MKHVTQIRSVLSNKKSAVSGAILTASLAVTTGAQAALPDEAAAVFTTASTWVTDVVAAAWPVVALFLAGSIGIKLTKRFVNKAT